MGGEGGKGYTDRTFWIIVFGVGELGLGLLCAALVPLMLLSMALVPAGSAGMPQPSLRSLAPAMGMYGALAVFFMIIGVGSIKRRRWARTVMLAVSYLWLAVGMLSLVMMALMSQELAAAISRNAPSAPAGAEVVFLAVTFAAVLAMYVVMPLIFVLFYSGANVKATFEAADPSPRWTDRCPLPVLATAMSHGLCGAWMLIFGMFYSYSAFPFFGKVLYGTAARAAIGVSAAAMLVLALGMLRLRTPAWWGSLILSSAAGLSSIITFSRIDMMEMMTKMGLSEAELKPMRDFNFMGGGRMAWWAVAWLAVWILWLLYLKRYFAAAKKAVADAP